MSDNRAIEVMVDALMADSGLSTYGQFRQIIERRQRRAVEALASAGFQITAGEQLTASQARTLLGEIPRRPSADYNDAVAVLRRLAGASDA